MQLQTFEIFLRKNAEITPLLECKRYEQTSYDKRYCQKVQMFALNRIQSPE